MKKFLRDLRDLFFLLAATGACVFFALLLGAYFTADKPSTIPQGAVIPNPYDANSYEIPSFQVLKNNAGVWRVAAPLMPPSMPIRVYLVVLDEGLKGKIKLKESSFVARHIPGVGWESPVRESIIRDFANTTRGYAAVIEIHGFVRRYGVCYDLDFSGLDKEPGFTLSEDSFALIAERGGKELEKTGDTK